MPTSNGEYPSNHEAPDPRIQVALSAPSAVLRYGETMDVTLVLTNVSDEVLTVHFAEGGDGFHEGENDCRATYGLFMNGQGVGGRPLPGGCATATGSATMQPGMRVEYLGRVETLTSREPRSPVPPGTYDLFMGFRGRTDNEPTRGRVWYAPPTQVTITNR